MHQSLVILNTSKGGLAGLPTISGDNMEQNFSVRNLCTNVFCIYYGEQYSCSNPAYDNDDVPTCTERHFFEKEHEKAKKALFFLESIHVDIRYIKGNQSIVNLLEGHIERAKTNIQSLLQVL